MSNLTKLEFVALDILSRNYLSWILGVEIHPKEMNHALINLNAESTTPVLT